MLFLLPAVTVKIGFSSDVSPATTIRTLNMIGGLISTNDTQTGAPVGDYGPLQTGPAWGMEAIPSQCHLTAAGSLRARAMGSVALIVLVRFFGVSGLIARNTHILLFPETTVTFLLLVFGHSDHIVSQARFSGRLIQYTLALESPRHGGCRESLRTATQ
jgi:hypothetical protein